MRLGWLVGLSVALAGGCDDRPAIQCPGERPLLEDCFVGRNFAECGGDGPDLFACKFEDDASSCRWFVGGCAPEGYVASSCPAEDLCCHDGFPFTDAEADYGQRSDVAWHLYGDGIRPWNRTDHMAISVAVDPSLVPEPTALDCSADFYPEFSNPCTQDYATAGGLLPIFDLLLISLGAVDLVGVRLLIEIDTTATPVRARACTAPYNDVMPNACPPHESVDCATSGTLTLNGIDAPTPIAGTVDLWFASGARLTGTFTVE